MWTAADTYAHNRELFEFPAVPVPNFHLDIKDSSRVMHRETCNLCMNYEN